MRHALTTVVAAACAALLAASPLAFSQDKAKGKLAKDDARALQRLAEADMAEVASGRLGQGSASSEDVKKFAAHMVEDHGRMLEEKKILAQAKGVKLPQQPAKRHQDAMKKLKEMGGGTDFDRKYMAQMVKDHQEALKLAEKTAKSAKDPDVKAAAQKGAPEIRKHLEEAKRIHASIGGGSASKGSSRKP